MDDLVFRSSVGWMDILLELCPMNRSYLDYSLRSCLWQCRYHWVMISVIIIVTIMMPGSRIITQSTLIDERTRDFIFDGYKLYEMAHSIYWVRRSTNNMLLHSLIIMLQDITQYPCFLGIERRIQSNRSDKTITITTTSIMTTIDSALTTSVKQASKQAWQFQPI